MNTRVGSVIGALVVGFMATGLASCGKSASDSAAQNSSGAGGSFCADARSMDAASKQVDNILSNAPSGSPSQSDAQKIVTDAQTMKDLFPKLQGEAPNDKIRGDLQTIGPPTLSFLTAIINANGDFSKLSQSEFQSLTNPSAAMTGAGNDFDSYLQSACGIVKSTTTTVPGGTSSTTLGSSSDSSGSGDKKAQDDLQTALTDATTVYAGTNDYSTIKLSDMESADPNLDWQAAGRVPNAATSTNDQVTMSVGGSNAGSAVELAALASTGTCWMLWQSGNSQTYFGKDTGGCASDVPNTAPTSPPASSGTATWQTSTFPS